jgi:hypothetical protein
MTSRAALLMLMLATTAAAQDSSFSRLRLRAAAFRLPIIRHIADDWSAGTGAHAEIASNVSRSDIGLAVSRIAFEPTTGHPPFTETFVSLGWTMPVARRGRAGIDAGARLTDVRMSFDDPAFVEGLRHEEEVLVSGLVRGRAAVGRGFGAFVEGSFGVQMLSTRTPMAMIAFGIERDGAMPGWLRGVLR